MNACRYHSEAAHIPNAYLISPIMHQRHQLDWNTSTWCATDIHLESGDMIKYQLNILQVQDWVVRRCNSFFGQVVGLRFIKHAPDWRFLEVVLVNVLPLNQQATGWIIFALMMTFFLLIYGDVVYVKVIQGWRNGLNWLHDDDDQYLDILMSILIHLVAHDLLVCTLAILAIELVPMF